MLLRPADLGFFAPQPVDATRAEARLERFPAHVAGLLAGQIGAQANLRSSTGCAVLLATDSPWLVVRLARLRHHQPIPQGIALEIHDQGAWQTVESGDLREQEGDVAVRLPTGLMAGQVRPCVVWLPPISTCAVAGIEVVPRCTVARIEPQEPRWLAIGDSLTQGFSAQSPLATWVHRLRRRWDLPAWNLGVGGIMVEPEAFSWALSAKRWDLVTVGLGSNHSWGEATAAAAGDRCAALCERLLAGGHRTIAWIIPPWKPLEDGKGPPEFMGVPLDAAAGARVRRVRDLVRATLARYPAILTIDDPMPHDHRWYPDGLHPFALGFKRYAEAVARVVEPQLAR